MALDDNGTVNVSRIEDGQLVSRLLLANTRIKAVVWIAKAEDQYLLATGCSDGTVRVWNIDSYLAKEVHCRTYGGEVEMLEYHDTSKRLFMVYNECVALWTMGEIRADENHPFNCGERLGGMGVLTSGNSCVLSQPHSQKL